MSDWISIKEKLSEEDRLKKYNQYFSITHQIESPVEFEIFFRENFWDLLA